MKRARRAKDTHSRHTPHKGGIMGSAPATKKVIVEFPEDLLRRAEEAASELSTNRSELIRSAVEAYLKARAKAELEKELAEGYRANAGLDQQIAQEFAHLDAENI